jgi:hypothetical protein
MTKLFNDFTSSITFSFSFFLGSSIVLHWLDHDSVQLFSQKSKHENVL